MKYISKFSLFVGAMFLIALVFPLFKNSSKDVTTAADEIRFTNGSEVKHPALGNNFIAWVEYRDGAYNIYYHDLSNVLNKTEDKKLNAVALSSDVIGPVVYQDRVVWADHTVAGWVITEYDVNHNTLRKLYTEANQVFGLAVYEDKIVYTAGKNNGSDVFVMTKDNVNTITPHNLTNDDIYQGTPSIYGNLVAWTEFPTVCQTPSIGLSTCAASQYGRVVTYDLVSNVRTTIKDNLANLSDVKLQNLTMVWSQLEGSTNVVKVYYVNTGTLITVSPSDNHSYNPVLGGDLIAYFVKRAAGDDLDLYQFSTGNHSTLSWSSAQKSEPALGPNSRYVVWIDNRLGTKDLFYYDSLASAPVTAATVTVATLDQDHDGLTDAEEIKLGTNPYDADTDHDGLTDYEEVKIYHTSLTQYDTDGDGISDGDEVHYWSSDPLKFDSNNDGIDDKTSIIQGYNPMANRSKLTTYRVQRMDDLNKEKELASYLKTTLNHYLGRGRWRTSGKADWTKVVNAYIYGGYNIKEIGAYVRGDKNAISGYKLATVLREEKAIAQNSSVYSATR